jgi:hypothetical protein
VCVRGSEFSAAVGDTAPPCCGYGGRKQGLPWLVSQGMARGCGAYAMCLCVCVVSAGAAELAGRRHREAWEGKGWVAAMRVVLAVGDGD